MDHLGQPWSPLVDPCHIAATPFVYGDCDQCNVGNHCATKAYRYWQTSRTVAVDTWIRAANLEGRLVAILSEIRDRRKRDDSSLNPVYVRLEAWKNKIQLLRLYVTEFCKILVSIEASGTLLDAWPETGISRYISAEISSLKDLPNGRSIWYLVVLDSLRDAITGHGNVALEEGITSSRVIDRTFESLVPEEQAEADKWSGHLWSDEFLFESTTQDLGLELGYAYAVPASEGLWREKIEGLDVFDASMVSSEASEDLHTYEYVIRPTADQFRSKGFEETISRTLATKQESSTSVAVASGRESVSGRMRSRIRY